MRNKIFAFGFISLAAFTTIPSVFAATDVNEKYKEGTKVEYVSNGVEAYTITVPARLNPGQTGSVTLSGQWSSDKTIVVSADDTVILRNTINTNDTAVLNITFPDMYGIGSNTTTQTFSQDITVESMQSNVLFGKWMGTFYYQVSTQETEQSALHFGEKYIVHATTVGGADWSSLFDGYALTFYEDGSVLAKDEFNEHMVTYRGNRLYNADGEDIATVSADGKVISWYEKATRATLYMLEPDISQHLTVGRWYRPDIVVDNITGLALSNGSLFIELQDEDEKLVVGVPYELCVAGPYIYLLEGDRYVMTGNVINQKSFSFVEDGNELIFTLDESENGLIEKMVTIDLGGDMISLPCPQDTNWEEYVFSQFFFENMVAVMNNNILLFDSRMAYTLVDEEGTPILSTDIVKPETYYISNTPTTIETNTPYTNRSAQNDQPTTLYFKNGEIWLYGGYYGEIGHAVGTYYTNGRNVYVHSYLDGSYYLYGEFNADGALFQVGGLQYFK